MKRMKNFQLGECFTPSRRAIIKETDNNSYWQVCKQFEILIHCWGDVKWHTCCQNQFNSPSKVENTVTV